MVAKQIRKWHLDVEAFTQLLKTTCAFIAGSFLLPCVLASVSWQPNDMDVWVSENAKKECALEFTLFLTRCGYAFPPHSRTIDSDTKHEYRRLSRTVKRILTFKHAVSKKCIQILLLKDIPLNSPLEIVLSFDLTVNHMHFDASTPSQIVCTNEALDAITNR